MLGSLLECLWISDYFCFVGATSPLAQPSPLPELPTLPHPSCGPCHLCSPASVLGRSSLPHPPQPTLASTGVWVALLWLLATGLSAEQVGISGFLGGGVGRKERRAGFLSWNHLETSYLGSEPFPSLAVGVHKETPHPAPSPYLSQGPGWEAGRGWF